MATVVTMETEGGIRFRASYDDEGTFVIFDQPVRLWTGEVLEGKVYTEQWYDWESFIADLEDAERV